MKQANENINISEVISLGLDEVVIKSMEAFHTTEPEGNAYFIFTNYRLIVYVKTSKTKDLFVDEYDIHGLSGISSRLGKVKDKKMSTIAKIILIVSVLVGIIGLIGMMSDNLFTDFANYLLIGAGGMFVLSLLIFAFGKRKVFFLELFSKENRNSIATFSSAIFKRKLDSIQIRPDQNAYKMSKTLGKAIIEAKNHVAGTLVRQEVAPEVKQEQTKEIKEEVEKKPKKERVKKKASPQAEEIKEEVEKQEADGDVEHVDGGIEIQEIS